MLKRGFGLLELMLTLALTAVLACLSYPSFIQVLHKTRRAQAQAALQQLQLAQERHRSSHTSYATLDQLTGIQPPQHYQLNVLRHDAQGYTLLATATGAQFSDLPCRYLALERQGALFTRQSGPSPALGNDDPTNRRCWTH